MRRLPPLLARLPIVLFALGALGVLWSVAYPATSLPTTIHGQRVRISFAAPHDLHLGKQLEALPSVFPCSVRVNIDPRWMGAYGADGYLVWMTAHEVGHCVERDLKGGSQIQGLDGPREAFADGWASLYLAQCGVTLRPFGFPDADPEAPTRMSEAELREAQACLPRASDVQEFRNPISVLYTVRRMHDLGMDGQPVPPMKPGVRTFMEGEARKVGINPDALPPARFGQ